MTRPIFSQLDSRKRISLAAIATAEQYLVTTEPGGRIILEPAVVMSQVEMDYLSNKAARATVERSRANPEDAEERPRTPVASSRSVAHWVQNIEEWLAEPRVAARDQGSLASTLEHAVPALESLGYGGQVEMEADVDESGRQATIKVLLHKKKGSPAAERLAVSIASPSGAAVRSAFSTYGLATLRDVDLSREGLEVTIERL